MSSERNQEVVGCGASIMKNVWEFRVREHQLKIKLEQERIQRSALPSIDQDWANRVVAKLAGYKRVERKIKRAEGQTDNNVWKSMHPQLPHALPHTLPHGIGSVPLSRPGSSSKGFSTAVPSVKDKKVQDKKINRLQLLMFITQTQPSSLVWGKSWKYNKSLPPPAEGSTDWGQSWIFATQQPWSEAGKPWQNEPNIMDPQNLHVWIKPDLDKTCRTLESQQLDLNLPTEDWKMSWKKSDLSSNKDTSSTNGDNISKYGLCTYLLETEHHDDTLHSSEWSDSWRSTKSGNQQDPFTVPDDAILNESVASKQDKNQEISSKWEECWRLANYQSCNTSKVPQHQKSHSPEWANSWRAAAVVLNNSKNSNLSLRKVPDNSFDDQNQHRESYFQEILPVSCEHKDKHLYLHIVKDFKAFSEWSKSWQVTKNNSKPCEEIEKILKALPPKTETEAQRVENNSKVNFSTAEEADAHYAQLKHDIIYQPKRQFSQSKSCLLKHLEKMLPFMELRDSWKIIKHRMRMERRRLRINLLNPFRDSEKGDDTKHVAAEWKDSWRFTCQPLYQEPELWQQGWSTTVNRAKEQSHFVPVDFPNNEGMREWSLGESWKFSRHQHQSESGPKKVQVNQESVTSHKPDKSWTQGRHAASIPDWQAAWMVSETQFHHDKPSLTQWREAWKWSIYHTHWPTENWVDESMEIQPLKGKVSLQRVKTKMSRTFDSQVFGERYPEKDWSPSWSTAPLFDHQPNRCGSSELIRQSISNTIQQQHVSASEHGCKWGRSFRLANPMPQEKQPWVESPSNQCQYSVMWSREKKIHSNIKNDFDNNPATYSLWGNSHEFLQRTSAQNEEKRKLKGPSDPRVIITKEAKSRRHLYSSTDKEKQLEKKWAGCHLLGKTQPRPRKGASLVKNPEDNTNEKFFEEWAESWRFLVRPGNLKNPMTFKPLTGWNESWKFLVPLYRPLNGPKAR